MSGGGGSTTTVQQAAELPQWLQDAAKENLAKARDVSQIGYTPYYGLDTAAFTPMQTSAMQNTANAASAFGLGAPTDVMAGMPQAQTNNLGFTGYSSGNMFDESLQNFAASRPAQYSALQSLFVDPLTGQVPMTYDTGYGVVNTRDFSIPTAQGYMSYDSASTFGDAPSESSGGGISDMSLGMENFLLGAANMEYPVWAPFGGVANAVKAGSGYLLDKRLDAIAEQQNIYDNVPAGMKVQSDMNGNLSLVKDPNYVAPAPSLTGAYSGGSYVLPSSGIYGVGGNTSSSSSSGGGYTGGGSSYGANPSSTISGGSGRTDGGFGW